MSKLLERLVLSRIRPHITNSLISLPCNLPIDLVSPQKPPFLIFPTYVEIASLIHSLQLTQNNLAKLVLLNPSLNSSECLRQLHWLPIHLRIIFKISLITYRTLATSNPPYLNQLIHRRHIPNHLRSSSTIHIHQPVHRSSIVNRGFTPVSPALWNDLPPSFGLNPHLNSSSVS